MCSVRCLLVITVLLSITAVSSAECHSHEHDLGGKRCCNKCPPGFGVTGTCSEGSNTVCGPCANGQSYSSRHSHQEACRPCRTCVENAHVKRACNVTHDTVCECDRDLYLDSNGECRHCDLCPHGWGVSRPCTPLHNTVCRKCPQGTYSDVLSATVGCVVCSVCRGDKEMLQECTPIQDTICLGPMLFLSDAGHPRVHRKTTKQSVADVVNSADDYTGRNIIPVYCAILGALVLGLLGYVVFKQWRLRGQASKMGAGGATVPLTDPESSPCISKRMGSDSGIVITTADCRGSRTITLETKLREVCSSKRRELEAVLNPRREQRDWKALARELGYTSTRIASFEQRGMEKQNGPTRHLFADWAKREDSTVHNLVRALRNIGRYDVIRVIQPSLERGPSRFKDRYGEIV